MTDNQLVMQPRDAIQVEVESAMHREISDHEGVRRASEESNLIHLEPRNRVK